VNDIQKYLAEEHYEDFQDGLITRRELFRRVTLILGSSTAAVAFIAACGGTERPAAATAATSAPTTAAPTAATAAASPAPAAVAYATPPAAATTDGITVKADDPRITAGPATVKAADGASLIGYMARPKADGKYPGVLVIHENLGLIEHIKDVTRRYATAGFAAVAIDLVSRDGGADKLKDQGSYNAALGKRTPADMARDLQDAIAHLKTQTFVNTAKIGATGFCFGGGMTWSLLNFAPTLVQAAAPYYGPAPTDVAGIGTTKAAVLVVYAELDTRVTAGRDTIEPQLKKAGVPYQINVYPGANHAFHADFRTDRYNAEQARKAWIDTIDWFKKYLA
jgi:carboxymethylenebutenolidase